MGLTSSSPLPIDDRLLKTAIDQFGRQGFEGASTRAIAAAAGTTMSSITYHYGGKQGLYLAAARHIAHQIGEHMEPALASQAIADPENARSEAALDTLLAIINRFAEMMILPESALWARFIVREQMEPTEAFDILYNNVVGPLVEVLSTLILRVRGNQDSPETARIKTLAIVGQALVFRVARATALRATGWSEVDADAAAEIKRIIQEHTKAILQGAGGGLTP